MILKHALCIFWDVMSGILTASTCTVINFYAIQSNVTSPTGSSSALKYKLQTKERSALVMLLSAIVDKLQS